MIVHIGLGKTGTTSLQKAVFPHLVKEGVLDEYNPPNVMEALRRYIITGEGADHLRVDLSKLPENTLISLENLAGWNPALWEVNASKNVAIFPETATILITLRDVESYLTSVYVQMVQQGNIIRPEKFILPDADYEFLRPFVRPDLCEIFKVDDLDYEGLVALYGANFKKVVVVPLSRLSGLDFMNCLFVLSEGALNNFRERFARSKRENISYSSKAINLTFLREKLLARVGLRTRSSHDQFFNKFSVRSDRSVASRHTKANRLFAKAFSKIASWMSWRRFMQQIVDRFFEYKKYRLPDSVPKGKKLEANKEFYERLTDLECGCLVVESGTRKMSI